MDCFKFMIHSFRQITLYSSFLSQFVNFWRVSCSVFVMMHQTHLSLYRNILKELGNYLVNCLMYHQQLQFLLFLLASIRSRVCTFIKKAFTYWRTLRKSIQTTEEYMCFSKSKHRDCAIAGDSGNWTYSNNDGFDDCTLWIE